MNPKRIGMGMGICLVAVAVLVDAVQLFLTLTVVGVVASPVLTFFAWTTFLIWFALLGVNYFDRGGASRVATMFASVVTELLPVVNAIPALTLGVIALIVQHNLQVEKQKRERDAARAAAASRTLTESRSSQLRSANNSQREEER